MAGSKVRAVRKGRGGNPRTKVPQDIPAKPGVPGSRDELCPRRELSL